MTRTKNWISTNCYVPYRRKTIKGTMSLPLFEFFYHSCACFCTEVTFWEISYTQEAVWTIYLLLKLINYWVHIMMEWVVLYFTSLEIFYFQFSSDGLACKNCFWLCVDDFWPTNNFWPIVGHSIVFAFIGSGQFKSSHY